MRQAQRGGTLAELLVAMSVFAMMLTAVFLLFGVGSRGFHLVEKRQAAQNQLAAIRAAVQQDLQTTHFYGIHVDDSTTIKVHGKKQPRNVLSAVSLSDWERPKNFSDAGVPLWDQWAAYRVTYEEKGQLVHHVVRPKPGSGRGRSLLRACDGLWDLRQTVAVSSRSWSADVARTQVLARNVRAFEAELVAERRAVALRITIEEQSDVKNPKPDVITAQFFVEPHNTVPSD